MGDDRVALRVDASSAHFAHSSRPPAGTHPDELELGSVTSGIAVTSEGRAYSVQGTRSAVNST
jgi:hypothetical protein